MDFKMPTVVSAYFTSGKISLPAEKIIAWQYPVVIVTY
jgi:hypothetical protein